MNLMAGPIMPYYCTDVIRQCIKKGLTDKPQTFGAQAVARGIDIPVAQLASQFADMARVRNTPQPDVFRVMLHMFTIVYLLLLPILSYDAMGYWIVPEGELQTRQFECWCFLLFKVRGVHARSLMQCGAKHSMYRSR